MNWKILSIISFIPNLIFAENAKIPLKEDLWDVKNLLSSLLDLLLKVSTPVIILALIYVGFLFVKSQGEPGKITEAKTALWYVILGIIIVIATNAIYHILVVSVN